MEVLHLSHLLNQGDFKDALNFYNMPNWIFLILGNLAVIGPLNDIHCNKCLVGIFDIIKLISKIIRVLKAVCMVISLINNAIFLSISIK